MTHFVREDTAADHQAAIDAKSDAQWLLTEYMNTLDWAWLKIRLEDACERLATKGDL